MKIKRYEEINEKVKHGDPNYSERTEYDNKEKKYTLNDVINAFKEGMNLESLCDGIPHSSSDYKTKVEKGIKDLIKKISK